MTVWVVGKLLEYSERGSRWELQGIFSSEPAAVRAAAGHQHYFVAPVEVDTSLPDETVDWPGCYYPTQLGINEEDVKRMLEEETELYKRIVENPGPEPDTDAG